MRRFQRLLTAALTLGMVTAASAQTTTSRQDFIKGVDISTLQALEDKGIKFYDGGKERDLLAILKARGVNYVRLRVWNNPVEAEGYNDKAKLLELAPRVKAAGLKLLVDFHYSDFWADPGKQVKPAAWEGLAFPQLQQAVYDYTKDVLTGLKAVGAYPDMVQIGNEINNGMIYPEGSLSNFGQLSALLKKGVQAVRDTTPTGRKTKVMLHLAEGGDNAKFRSFFDQITAQGVDYDVIGLSYYPYWHGTFGQLKTNMDDLAVRYNKEIVVAETAYPYSLANGDASKEIIAGLEQTKIAGFPASVANQKLVVQTVLNTVAQVKGGKGLGAFYWEPAWLPGVGWRKGDYNAWENQAMFDFKGNALDSLNAFKYTPGSLGTAAPIMVYPAPTVSTVKGKAPALPTQVDVLYNEGSIKKAAVKWNPVTAQQLSTPGKVRIEGTVTGMKQKASVEITVAGSENLVKNPGFESGLTGWTMTGTQAGKIDEKAGNAHSGSGAFNYWYGEPYSYKLTQKLTGLKNGTYTLRAWASGLGGETTASLFAEGFGGPAVATPIINKGWNVWKGYTIENIRVTNGTILLGFGVESPKEIWGFFDDVELTQVSAK